MHWPMGSGLALRTPRNDGGATMGDADHHRLHAAGSTWDECRGSALPRISKLRYWSNEAQAR